MVQQNEGAAAPSATASEAPPPEPEQRSFLGRIWEALTPNEPQGETKDPNEVRSERVAGAAPGSTPGLANLRHLRVDDVAVPKSDIIAVPDDIGKDELVAVFREHGFSRVPVYKGSLDHPQGLVLLKDLALQHGFGAGGRFALTKLLRPILYAPPSMAAGMLLQKMQKERVHMALVIDEYGGVDGLVTIEDLIETIIGEIEDEHDEAEAEAWREEAPGVYLVQSTAPLDEFEALIGLTLRGEAEEDEIDTIGGLVFRRAGKVPSPGEIITHESGVRFEIVEADARRLKRLRLRLPPLKEAGA